MQGAAGCRRVPGPPRLGRLPGPGATSSTAPSAAPGTCAIYVRLWLYCDAVVACAAQDVPYSYRKDDVGRELARRYGVLERSVDGRRTDSWDEYVCAGGREPLPAARRAPPRRGALPPGAVAAGGLVFTPLDTPAGCAGPPPARNDFEAGPAGASRYQGARTRWYEAATGVPLVGTAAERDQQYRNAVREYRHDARARPARPSPRKERPAKPKVRKPRRRKAKVAVTASKVAVTALSAVAAAVGTAYMLGAATSSATTVTTTKAIGPTPFKECLYGSDTLFP